jgi:tetratricopeptide (TPR) repeat protein
VAENRIAHISASSEDYFYLGGALGFKGRFELMKGNLLSSFFLSRDAIDALETCLEMEPNNRDVLLGLGIFDYYTAHLSGALKFLTYLLLHRGSKEEGLRKLHLAAGEAIYSQTEANSMLLHIYLFIEEDFAKALKLAQDLARKYTQNPRYMVLAGVCFIRLGMDLQYWDMVGLLRQKGMEASTEKEAAVWDRRALYLETIYYLYHGPYDEARSKLRWILNHGDPEKDPLMIAWPLAKIGMSYDLEGNREEAIKYYNKVLHMANGAGAQFFAQKCIKNNPGKNDPFIGF